MTMSLGKKPTAAKALRALLVDDHHVVIEALKTGVPAMRAFDRIDSASSLATAIEALASGTEYHLVILDLHLTDAQGRETLVGLRERFPDVPVLVFSGDAALDYITMAFECGARGYVTKTSSMSVVDSAIRLVLAGGTYVPPDAVRLLSGGSPATGPELSTDAGRRIQLSPRQEQVFQLLLQGMPNKVIAARLDMAEGTAKAHLNTVFRVLGVRTRVEAILRARELGLI
jgi:DNA-binding NarL/FixJ family response regulator